MALTFLIAIGLVWLERSACTQRESVAAIQQAGGHVTYYSDTLNGFNGLSWWRRLLFYHFGTNYHDHIDSVYYSRVWNDAALRHVGGLSGLVRLDASVSSVSDAGLVHLRELTRLSYLDLQETPISDAGLRHLEKLTSLSVLGLRGTRVTDSGLDYLKGLTNLRLLNIDVALSPDGRLPDCEGPPKLSNLEPHEPMVTSAGIKLLKQRLPSLTIEVCR
jgi:hypothetical protein